MQNTRLRPCTLTAIAAVLSCTASGAIVQSSATLHSTIDTGLQYQNRSAVSGSITEVRSGGTSLNIWGLRGSEDLGSELKANFNLEGHFNNDTGTLITDPGFSFEPFHRQANVSLSGNWGMITLGCQYGPASIGTINTEVRGFKEQFSNLYGWTYNQLPAPGNAIGADTSPGNGTGVFIGNALQYSNNFGPVWLGVMYSFEETAGSFRRGNELSLGVTYMGPATAGLGYQPTTDNGAGKTLSCLQNTGVAVPFGVFTGRVSYTGVTNNVPTGQRVSDVKSIGAELDYKWSPANTVTLASYCSKYENSTHDSSTRSVVLSNDCAFSKRTTLYVQLAYVNAGAVGTVNPLESLKTSIVTGDTAPNAKTVLAGVGPRHSFWAVPE